MSKIESGSAAPPKPRRIKHVVNGDYLNGWYCYECEFFTRNVEEAAKHDGKLEVGDAG